MLEKGKISEFQLFTMISMFLFGSTLILQSMTTAGKDTWISNIIAIFAGLGIVLIITSLANRYPDKTLIEYVQMIFGKIIGKIIGAMYLWYFLHLGALVLRNYGELFSTAIMEETPIWFFHLSLALVAGVLVYYRLEVMGRVSELFFPLLISLTLVTLILLIFSKVIDFENLLPIFNHSIGDILLGSIPLASVPFSELILFSMIFPYLNNVSKSRKASIISVIITGLILFMILVQDITILGEYMATLSFPRFYAVRKIAIGEFIERIEPLVLVIWLMSGMVKIAICLYAFVLGTAQLAGLKDYKHLIMASAIMITVLANILYGNMFEMLNFAANIYPIYAFPFQVALPLLMLLLTVWKQRKGRKKQLKAK